MAVDQTYSISSAASSNMTSNVTDVVVSPRTTDATQGNAEYEYINSNWSQQLGYYKTIPEVKIGIDMRATWTLGRGYKAEDARTKVILDHVSGFGRDTFNSILRNLIIVRRIGGDSFAEIIKDPETGTLINLKPLDPGTIKIITDGKGIIKRYEQVSKVNLKGKNKPFKKEEIFHLTNKRIADECHGASDIDPIIPIVKAHNESFKDMIQLMHRHVKPIMAFKLDTDNQAKIDAFVTKMDAVVNKGENIYVPKDTVEYELISVPSNATLNPLPWMQKLTDYYFQVVGIPQVILGSASDITESASKIVYLAFQQSVEEEQLDIEEAIWNQLFLKINLEFPASLQNEMLSDNNKDGRMAQTNMQPSDMTAGEGR